MAEPTCVMHPPFSYTAPEFPTETHQENPMYGIGESVSFGRFTTDNLSWEKWSSFNSNRNRYVEEAEKYSKPGSVAQKKAYFEAHFKRMAALKAAALLEEQANSATNDMSQANSTESDVQNLRSNAEVEAKNFAKQERVEAKNFAKQERVEAKNYEQERVEARNYEQGRVEAKDAGFVVHQNELYSVGGEVELAEANNVKETDLMVKDNRSLNQNEVKSVDLQDKNCNANKEGLGEVAQMDKPSLQKTSIKEESSAPVVKRNRPLSSFMSSMDGIGRASLFASSPARTTAASVHPGKENYATPIKQKSNINNPDKKRTPLRASINREFNKILSPVIRKIGSSSKGSKDCSTPLKTPVAKKLQDYVNGVPEPPPLTPNLAKRGARSRLDMSAPERKTPGPRWHILSTDGFKSPSTSKSKISSPIIPTSFCMSGERAARRKQKLEEKFNATTTEKAPQPSKFKEKAEAELNKFRQSFCFKAMSSPDYQRENETLKSPKQKSESTRRSSPRRVRQPQTLISTSQNRSSLPPRRPAVKLGGSMNV